jgi:hypothetical protein
VIDYAATRAVTLVAGRSGTGKTTFCLRYLVNASHLRGRWIWDADGQISARLGLPAASTAEDLEASMEDGWSIFDPNVLFPGRHAEGFSWFAGWAYGAAARTSGPSCLLVDEVWRYCSPHAIPQPLAECIQTGRVRGLSCMFATQRPNKLNGSVLNEVTECVGFRLQDRLALSVVAECGLPASEVSCMAPGSWLSVSCETGARMSGRLW